MSLSPLPAPGLSSCQAPPKKGGEEAFFAKVEQLKERYLLRWRVPRVLYPFPLTPPSENYYYDEQNRAHVVRVNAGDTYKPLFASIPPPPRWWRHDLLPFPYYSAELRYEIVGKDGSTSVVTKDEYCEDPTLFVRVGCQHHPTSKRILSKLMAAFALIANGLDKSVDFQQQFPTVSPNDVKIQKIEEEIRVMAQTLASAVKTLSQEEERSFVWFNTWVDSVQNTSPEAAKLLKSDLTVAAILSTKANPTDQQKNELCQKYSFCTRWICGIEVALHAFFKQHTFISYPSYISVDAKGTTKPRLTHGFVIEATNITQTKLAEIVEVNFTNLEGFPLILHLSDQPAQSFSNFIFNEQEDPSETSRESGDDLTRQEQWYSLEGATCGR